MHGSFVAINHHSKIKQILYREFDGEPLLINSSSIKLTSSNRGSKIIRRTPSINEWVCDD